MIVVITGYRRCGKDYLAQNLINYLNKKYKVQHFAFANPLKDYITDLFGISIDDLEKLKENKSVKFQIFNKIYNMREFLVKFANKLREFFGDDIWAKATLNQIKKQDSNEYIDIKIITDMRFLTEYKIIKDFAQETNEDLFIIRLDSDIEGCEKDNLDEKEIKMIPFDYKFFNSKENFNNEFNKLIEILEKKLNRRPRLF